MNTGQCVLCLKPEAEFIANKVVKKDLTNQQAAKELGVSLDIWLSHYELHVRQKLITSIAHDIVPLKEGLLEKIKEGMKSMNRVITLTEQIHKSLLNNKSNQENTRLIMAYATLEKNVISGLKELAILEGDVNTATQINIQNNTVKVDKLMAIVLEDSTPAQAASILKKLETVVIDAN